MIENTKISMKFLGVGALLAASFVLWGTACGGGEDDPEITGVCWYESASRPWACRNLWDGDESCVAAEGEAGRFEGGSSCSENGYPHPCVHDHPASLWVADEVDCADWE